MLLRFTATAKHTVAVLGSGETVVQLESPRLQVSVEEK